SKAEPTSAPTAERGCEVGRLDYPFAVRRALTGIDRLTGEIKVERTDHVHSGVGYEQSKGAANARIYVNHLILTVACIEDVIDINNADIANCVDEPGRDLNNLVVREGDAQTGNARIGRVLANFLTRKAEQALGFR